MISTDLVTNTNPQFWEGSNPDLKMAILDAIIRHVGEDQRLGKTEWNRCQIFLKKRLNGRRAGPLSDTQFRVVRQVLNAINRTGLIRCDIPPAPIKGRRPSVLPDTQAQWAALQPARAYREHVNRTLKTPDNTEDWATILYYELVWLGYGLDPAVSILSKLLLEDLGGAGAVLSTPVHYLDSGKYRHETLLPEALCTRLGKLQRFNQKHAHGRLKNRWAITLPDDELKETDSVRYKRRFNALKRILEKQHSERFRAWSEGLPAQHAAPSKLMTKLTYFTRVLRLNALAGGLEPMLFSSLDAIPLPADAPGGLRAFLKPSAELPMLIHRPSRQTEPEEPSSAKADWALLAELPGEPQAIEDVRETLSEHWALDGKFLLRRFISDLQNQLRPGKITAGDKKTLTTLVQSYVTKARVIAPNTSVVTLAILWLSSKLFSGQINVSTAKNYMSAIIINGILEYEASYDLNEWDDEDVDMATRHVMNRPRLADTTRSNRQDRLGQFLAFCRSNGLMTEVNFEKEGFAYAVVKRRNTIPNLGEFDNIHHQITQSAEPQSRLVNVILIMGFYGGLRSCEMLSLTLDDIECCGPEIYLRIRGGKTVAARRKIPIHLIAPTRYCDLLREHLNERLSLARAQKVKPKKVAFLGPKESTDGYGYNAIIPAVIRLLRYYSGKKIDLHTLRHGFGTWIMLRAHALKYPDFKAQLLEQNHLVFSPEGEQRFTQLFQWSEDQPFNPNKIDLYIHIRKLIGHSHISVLMQNYLHAFGAIHQHWLKRLADG